ncbi:MAG: prolyl oligopeptidase family serine peptidase, partial [Alistipes sp.]|nr:prolyl oligopeptidase family serine peptidase [Alistipes sp.]
AHSLKFATTLQQAQGGAPPILLRIETEAGHGLGKPTAKRIDGQTDQMAFMMWNMGLKA